MNKKNIGPEIINKKQLSLAYSSPSFSSKALSKICFGMVDKVSASAPIKALNVSENCDHSTDQHRRSEG